LKQLFSNLGIASKKLGQRFGDLALPGQDAPEMVGIIKSFEEAQGVHEQLFHHYILNR
jgi:hypothetical protein